MHDNILARKMTGSVNIALVNDLYDQHIVMTNALNHLRQKRNQLVQVIATSKDNDPSLIKKGKELKSKIIQLNELHEELQQKLNFEASKLPNWIHPDTPQSGEAPKLKLKCGIIPTKEGGGMEIMTHLEMAKEMDWIQFPKLSSSSKFYYGKHHVALLEIALINWAMNYVTHNHGFIPLTTPDLVSYHYAEACGFQPRSPATQIYNIRDSDLCLVGTQEIPLASLYSNQIIEESELPIRMVGFGHCFRHETGSTNESRGLYRVHQFSKVEMFVICKPQDSEKYHQELLNIEIDLLKQLGLAFQVIDIPADDLGAAAYRKYDIETWMPYKEGYGEVTSCSNCLDYQSRRLGIRYRSTENEKDAEKNPYVHTLNATALAAPRIILSILENFQQPGRTIKIPLPLVPFMAGETVIPLSNVTQNQK